MSSSVQGFDANKMCLFFDAIESNTLGMGSLSIYHDGKEVFQRSMGFEVVERNVPADSDTRYRIGSITKSFMAAIIVQMIEENKLQLDTKLSAYYPVFEDANKITIEHLLRHQSGLFNFTNDPAYETYMESPQSQEALLEKMTANRNTFVPGKEMQYSNTGYVLLSFIAEKVDGNSFSNILKDRIAEPHDLKNTYYGGKIGVKDNEAHSYYMKDSWTQSIETDMSIPMGAGAIVSTPGDISKFYHALFSGKIVNASSVDLMISMKENYGLGLTEFQFGSSRKAIGHDGSIDGFKSIAGHFSDDNASFCYISNGSVLSCDKVIEGAMSIYFGRDYKIPDFRYMILPLTISKFSDDPQLINRVERLLNQGANINAQTSEGDTAVILAGWLTSNLALIRFLVEKGADVNIPNENGDTPLIDAAYLGKNEILEYLLNNGAEIAIKNKSGRSALDMARRKGNSEAVKMLDFHQQFPAS